MLAETVGCVRRRALLQLVEIHLPVVERNRLRLRGSRTSSGRRRRRRRRTEEERVGLASPGRRGCGDAMSIHARAGRSARHACATPTGTTPQAPGTQRHAAAVEVQHRRALEDVEALLERVDVRDRRARRRARTGRGPYAPSRRAVDRGRAARTRRSAPRRPGAGTMSSRRISAWRVTCSIQPPSTSRLTPLTAPILEQEDRTRRRCRSVVTSRPIGVRARTFSSTAGGLPLQAGVSPTIPGWMALTRTGASSTASVRIMARDAAVDGRDRRRARVRAVLREAAEEQDRRVRPEPRRQRVHDLGVADELERDEAHRAGRRRSRGRVVVALDRGEHEPVDSSEAGERAGDPGRLGEVEARCRSSRRRSRLPRPRSARPASRPVITTCGRRRRTAARARSPMPDVPPTMTTLPGGAV